MRFRLSSTGQQSKTLSEPSKRIHLKRCPEWRDLKMEPYRISVDGENRGFWKRWRHPVINLDPRALLFKKAAKVWGREWACHAIHRSTEMTVVAYSSVFERIRVDGEKRYKNDSVDTSDTELLMRFRRKRIVSKTHQCGRGLSGFGPNINCMSSPIV